MSASAHSQPVPTSTEQPAAKEGHASAATPSPDEFGAMELPGAPAARAAVARTGGISAIDPRMQVMRIDADANRFKQIVKGQVRQNMRHYVTHPEMIGRKDGKLISIPMKQLQLPHFKYGKNGRGGVGQGEGDPGQPLGKPGDPANGSGGAGGSDPGQHLTEVELEFDEFIKIMGEEMGLPRLEPKGKQEIESTQGRVRSIRPVGPNSLKHMPRSYKRAILRQQAEGTYDLKRPKVVVQPPDRRFRDWEHVPKPECAAVVFHIMDISGSIGKKQKEIIRGESQWIDGWLGSQYPKGVRSRYILHDVAAKEVKRETFYTTKEGGGTSILSAFTLADKIAQTEHPFSLWNVYYLYWSDGDNRVEGNDTEQTLALMERMLKAANLIGINQVDSQWGSGKFRRDVIERFGSSRENLVVTELKSKDDIWDSMRKLFGSSKKGG